MEIDSIRALPNYLADTLADIADGTLAIQPSQSFSSFTKFPKHWSATQEKTSQRKPQGRAPQMSRAPSHNSPTHSPIWR